MRATALILILLTFLAATPPARAAATNGLVEVHTETGIAYLGVLLRREPDRLLSYLLITRKLPTLPVAYGDVKFELLDEAGNVISTTQVPKEPLMVETPDPLGTTANGLYLVTLGPDQSPTSARVTWQGKTIELPEVKMWAD